MTTSTTCYYPPHLVQKVADELRKFDELLDAGERDPQKIQARADEVTKNINTLEDEFDEADSEIEELIAERDWYIRCTLHIAPRRLRGCSRAVI